MNLERLDMILAQFSQKKILVVGDFVLDKRLVVDPSLAETSAETGLEAHQVVEVAAMPGGAGWVAGHVAALGADALTAGMVGDDGDGFELLRALDAAGANVDGLVIRTDRFTPTYITPVLRVRGGALRQLNRLDIKNRAPIPREVEDQVIRTLRGLLPRVHGVIIVDHVPEEDFGVVTERVRDELAVLAQTYGEAPFVAVSTRRSGQFANALITVNAREAVQMIDPGATWQGDGDPDWAVDRPMIEAAGERLYRKNGQPVFLMLGEHGTLALHAEGPTLVPALPVRGVVDVARARAAAVAGITAALCAGASVAEAAEVGGLAAAATQQAGGAASRKQMIELKRGNRQ